MSILGMRHGTVLPTHQLPLLRRMIVRSAMVPLVILGTYALCGVLTWGRKPLAPACLAFERGIPLAPAMLIPYLSLDVLLIAAFFLCHDETALCRLTRSLLAGTAMCAAGFLLFPLACDFPADPPDGLLAPLLATVRTVDHTNNRCPSLHVVITLLLWPVFARTGRGFGRILVHLWFLTMIASTMLTHQHHLVDVAMAVPVAGAADVFAGWTLRSAVRGVSPRA